MVDTEQENTAAAKSILKRRVRNERAAATAEEAATATAERDVANLCKRFVTFDDTITVKNDKDLVVKKPLKLELVIDHWKSSGGGGAKAASDWAARPDSGVVKRLVNEFNAVQDLFTDNSDFDTALLVDDKFKEDESTKIQSGISLCGALETVNLTTDV